MADPTWPTGLRRAGALGVQGGPQANVDAFNPEIGPPITRRKSTGSVRIYQVSLPLISATERGIFRTFFHTTLKEGNLPFLWVDPMIGYTGSFATRMKFLLQPGQSAYSETRVTKDLFTLGFSVVLL